MVKISSNTNHGKDTKPIHVKAPQEVSEPYTLHAGEYLGSNNDLSTGGLFWKRNGQEAIWLHVHVEW